MDQRSVNETGLFRCNGVEVETYGCRASDIETLHLAVERNLIARSAARQLPRGTNLGLWSK